MKASIAVVLLFFVLGVSNGRSRFSSSEVNDVDVDAENVTSPGKFTDCEVTCHSLLHPSGMIEQLKSSERTTGDCSDKKSTFFCIHSEAFIFTQLKKIKSIIYIFFKTGYFANKRKCQCISVSCRPCQEPGFY